MSRDSSSDIWSDWLLHRRHADDPAYEAKIRAAVERMVDRVLDAAHLTPGMTLADIGSGEGLTALCAIRRIGPSLRVILTDISLPMLRYAESLAAENNLQGQCTFLHLPAENLAMIPDACVDAVTTRAVLAYVSDKPAALREFHRVLKPGGRMSVAEPIFQDEAFETAALKKMTAVPSPEKFLPLLHRFKSAMYPDTEEKIAQSPIANYSERDLVRFAREAGFAGIHMELHIDIVPSQFTSWKAFLGSSPHPLAPAAQSILNEKFTPVERAIFEQVVRPTIESGRSITTQRIAYLSATRPPSPA